jgi:brefeldin A-resistance guanine nucleotide exchange factor 1
LFYFFFVKQIVTIFFQLLTSERLSVFAADLQVCFLMFESLRTHLKFQLEFYLTKLIDIIVTDSGKVSYEYKEIALDNILQLWRIPGLVTELYLNYDCNMYCTNLYEDLTKLLAKNAFSATSGVYHTHMLSLDALLTVIESIEQHCIEGKTEKSTEVTKVDASNETIESINNFIGKSTRQKISEHVPSKEELMGRKNIKKVSFGEM